MQRNENVDERKKECFKRLWYEYAWMSFFLVDDVYSTRCRSTNKQINRWLTSTLIHVETFKLDTLWSIELRWFSSLSSSQHLWSVVTASLLRATKACCQTWTDHGLQLLSVHVWVRLVLISESWSYALNGATTSRPDYCASDRCFWSGWRSILLQSHRRCRRRLSAAFNYRRLCFWSRNGSKAHESIAIHTQFSHRVAAKGNVHRRLLGSDLQHWRGTWPSWRTRHTSNGPCSIHFWPTRHKSVKKQDEKVVGWFGWVNCFRMIWSPSGYRYMSLWIHTSLPDDLLITALYISDGRTPGHRQITTIEVVVLIVLFLATLQCDPTPRIETVHWLLVDKVVIVHWVVPSQCFLYL